MTDPSDNDDDSDKSPLLSHLYELRNRLLWITASVAVFFFCLLPFANKLYTYLAVPLLAHLPQGGSMVAIDVASPFLAPFKLVFLLGIMLAIPVILYHAWAFVAPGLYKSEKRLAFPILVSSSILFYVGMTFAYFIVFPLMFGFFTRVAPQGVTVMTDISRYLDFVLKVFIAFGVAFEVPIVTLVLVKLGIATPRQLAAKRPYVIVAAFIVGMLLTPPDVVSQILLALPVWVLFEIGLLLSRLVARQRGATPETDQPGGDDPRADTKKSSKRPSRFRPRPMAPEE